MDEDIRLHSYERSSCVFSFIRFLDRVYVLKEGCPVFDFSESGERERMYERLDTMIAMEVVDLGDEKDIKTQIAGSLIPSSLKKRV